MWGGVWGPDSRILGDDGAVSRDAGDGGDGASASEGPASWVLWLTVPLARGE